MRRIILLLVLGIVLAGCATGREAYIYKTKYRTVIVLGEHISPDVFEQQRLRFASLNLNNALINCTESRGVVADSVSNSLSATLGPSSAMRSLIKELEAMNKTNDSWKIIIPKISERYFLVTLKNMKEDSMLGTHGNVYLVDSNGNPDIETEVDRVSGGTIRVKYSLE